MVKAVPARYQHLADSWRRATPERLQDLIGELQLLMPLPAAGPDDPDNDNVGRPTSGHPGLGHRDQHRVGGAGLNALR